MSITATLPVSQLNDFFSSDQYGDFVREFNKFFSNKKEQVFNIIDSGCNGIVLKDDNNITLGYIPSFLTNEEHKKYLTGKTFHFFVQRGAFAYSHYEMVKSSVSQMLEVFLKKEKIPSSYEDISKSSDEIIFRLIEDLVI